MEIEVTTWTEFPMGGKAIVKHILASEEINNPKEHHWASHSQGSE